MMIYILSDIYNNIRIYGEKRKIKMNKKNAFTEYMNIEYT